MRASKGGSSTHIIPVELEEICPSTKATTSLPNSRQDVLGRHGRVDRLEDAPLGSGVDLLLDRGGKSIPEIAIYQLRVALV